jgi:pimeloyl-ACP methyl ester carboxylesterase
MSVDTQPAGHRTGTEAPRTPRRRSSARTVVTSVSAGAVLALVLTLVVFPGATEGVITGSILVAFGIGWALLAASSRSRATEPQTWAKVPAVAMTATGFALVAFEPGGGLLTAAGWVWPVGMMALVVWMVPKARRHLSKIGRWVLAPVMVVLALASLGAAYEDVAAVHDRHAHPASGRMVEVHGHRLHLDCRGHGGPTVVLFNGLGEVTASWAWITRDLSRAGRVCAYDRAGQGWSEDAAHPQDGITVAQDLHAVLAKAGEPGPYVLVGHSIGGTFALTYAARYPSQVAGMVLLDSSSPEQFTRMPAYPGQYQMIRRVYALLPTLYRLGLGRAGAALAPSHLPHDAADQVRAVTADAHGARSMRDEASMLRQVFAQAQALTTLDDKPLAVVTASGSLKDTDGWAAAQAQLANLSTDRLQQVVKASHEGVLEDAHAAAVSAEAITDVIDAVRSGSPVSAR